MNSGKDENSRWTGPEREREREREPGEGGAHRQRPITLLETENCPHMFGNQSKRPPLGRNNE